MLNPLLCSLFLHNCGATHSYNTITEFAEDMTVIGLITGNIVGAYIEEIFRTKLHLSVSKIKELTLDYITVQKKSFLLRKNTAGAIKDMYKDFYNSMGIPNIVIIVWGYLILL